MKKNKLQKAHISHIYIHIQREREGGRGGEERREERGEEEEGGKKGKGSGEGKGGRKEWGWEGRCRLLKC